MKEKSFKLKKEISMATNRLRQDNRNNGYYNKRLHQAKHIYKMSKTEVRFIITYKIIYRHKTK